MTVPGLSPAAPAAPGLPSGGPLPAHAAPGLPLAARGLSFAVREGRGRAPREILALPALDLPAGAFTVLTGPSGSGKSTLLYLLSGLLRPSGGSVVWGDTDLSRLGEAARDRWRRRNAGFVFQNVHLIDELSPVENVLLPARFGGGAPRLRARAAELLARFGVPEGRARAALLSRGEQQRTALARALLFAPAVIFADEPTASLDAATGQEVVAALRALAEEEGRTVIAASHDPALIAAAGRCLSLNRGRPGELP